MKSDVAKALGLLSIEELLSHEVSHKHMSKEAKDFCLLNFGLYLSRNRNIKPPRGRFSFLSSLALALYVINKEAKKARYRKNRYYFEDNYYAMEGAKRKEQTYYWLKDQALSELIACGKAKEVGIHIQELTYYDEDDETEYMCQNSLLLIEFAGYTFHQPLDDERPDLPVIGKIVGEIPSTLTKPSFNLKIAKRIVRAYLGIGVPIHNAS